MHNSHYFLRIVARELDVRLKNYRLVSCFSQTRDELVFEFYKDNDHFFIRASLLPELTSVSFPSSVKRARKNSVDLFGDVVMKNVEGAKSYANDRSFSIVLEGGLTILFKMHGTRGNVLLLKEDQVVDLFRRDIVKDLDLTPENLTRAIDWSVPPADPRREVFTFSAEVWRYLDERGINDKSADEQWRMICDTKTMLESSKEFFHIDDHQRLAFSLVPYNTVAARFNDPFIAVTAFVAAFSANNAFQSEKHALIRQLKHDIARAEAYIKKTREHLDRLSSDQHFQVWGDLLIANLEKIPAGAKEVTLMNFYESDVPVKIKLNPQLSPQKNAETYYRKSKNRSIEMDRSRELLIAREMELLKLNQQLVTSQAANTLAEVRAIENPEVGRKQNAESRLPYREVEISGFRIWVGKGAQDNDELTLHHGFKEDLWLHAKDTAGSHVLIKHQSGKVFPKNVIERAAQLAAFYSKRKTESLCAVAYTPRKYVRKRKGDPPGMVVVEREKVILVEPRGI